MLQPAGRLDVNAALHGFMAAGGVTARGRTSVPRGHSVPPGPVMAVAARVLPKAFSDCGRAHRHFQSHIKA
jgi:hypothetical protein